MPFPPARSTITSIPTTLICLRRCVASIDQRQNRLLKSGKKCLVVIDERRQTLGGWRIVGCLMRQLIDRWKIKKPLPTCFFHQSSIAWRKGKEISSLSTYEGSFLRCVSMLDAMSRNAECEEDRSGEGWGDCYFACCADIGCQNTNNQYSRLRCYDGAWDLVVLK